MPSDLHEPIRRPFMAQIVRPYWGATINGVAVYEATNPSVFTFEFMEPDGRVSAVCEVDREALRLALSLDVAVPGGLYRLRRRLHQGNIRHYVLEIVFADPGNPLDRSRWWVGDFPYSVLQELFQESCELVPLGDEHLQGSVELELDLLVLTGQ